MCRKQEKGTRLAPFLVYFHDSYLIFLFLLFFFLLFCEQFRHWSIWCQSAMSASSRPLPRPRLPSPQNCDRVDTICTFFRTVSFLSVALCTFLFKNVVLNEATMFCCIFFSLFLFCPLPPPPFAPPRKKKKKVCCMAIKQCDRQESFS